MKRKRLEPSPTTKPMRARELKKTEELLSLLLLLLQHNIDKLVRYRRAR